MEYSPITKNLIEIYLKVDTIKKLSHVFNDRNEQFYLKKDDKGINITLYDNNDTPIELLEEITSDDILRELKSRGITLTLTQVVTNLLNIDDLLIYLNDVERIYYKYLYKTNDDNHVYYIEKNPPKPSYKIMKYNIETQKESPLLAGVTFAISSKLSDNINDIIKKLFEYDLMKYRKLRPLTREDIQTFITDSKNYYRDIFDSHNKKYYLYRNREKNVIELNNSKHEVKESFSGIKNIDATTISTELNKLGITHTTNQDLIPNADKGGKRRSKSRIRRKRSQKRKKYKRRQHTYRKSKTKA